MQSTVNLPVLHGDQSWPIAIRLALDLCSEGFVATPVALGGLTPDVRAELFAEIEALVVVYDGQTRITPDMEAALDELHLRGVRVVFARTRTSRYPDYFPFPVVVLFDMPTFSNYQPNKQGTSGFAAVAGLLRMRLNPMPPQDRRRRGYAFISYASEDLGFVNGNIVPALARCQVGIFDYRFTARFDERTLVDEIKREMKRSAVIIVAASIHWVEKEYTRLEREYADELGRPLIAVVPSEGEVPSQMKAVPCRFGHDLNENAAALGNALAAVVRDEKPA